ncbi:MAG: LptA/OstA family protein [Candidatus Rickettsia vulgarisii]
MIYNLKLLLVFCCLLVTCLAVADEQKNNLHKLYINSDNLVINQAKKQAEFTGEVILWFDDLMIKTTNLEIYYKIVDDKKLLIG